MTFYYKGHKSTGGSGTGGTGGSGVAYQIGHGLKVENGTLSVDTVDDFHGDTALPITARGVEAIVGNIEALLSTI